MDTAAMWAVVLAGCVACAAILAWQVDDGGKDNGPWK
jgi:hypothetical protein